MNQSMPAPSSSNRGIPFEALNILSPKRAPQAQTGWDGFFPYYAGYPESFARSLLKSADLPSDAVVLDPWNGSGTTTFSAAHLGLSAQGFDLNPVMVIIARARLLAASEADSLSPLARDTLKGLRADGRVLADDDPLLWCVDRRPIGTTHDEAETTDFARLCWHAGTHRSASTGPQQNIKLARQINQLGPAEPESRFSADPHPGIVSRRVFLAVAMAANVRPAKVRLRTTSAGPLSLPHGGHCAG
jgi:hypothetical protein